MGPDGQGFLAAVVAVVVLISVAVVLRWRRLPATGWRSGVVGAGLLVTCQAAAAAVALVALNCAGHFYTSWSDLAGHKVSVEPLPLPDHQLGNDVGEQLRRQHHVYGSAVISLKVPIAGSTATQAARVYLPAAYFDPAYVQRRFPVVELLDGFPGSPQSWLQSLDMAHIADGEIVAGRAVPFVAVLPVQNYQGAASDGQCLDIPGKALVETTLATNVRAVVVKALRVATDRRSWAVMGYSTGGYCATNLLLRRPDIFGAGVSIGGNVSPYQDATTGPVFVGRPQLRCLNDPIWRLGHVPVPDVALLMVTSHGDGRARRQARQLLEQAHAPMRAYQLDLANGGHNFHTFKVAQQAGFDWLSEQLVAPLAPAVRVDNKRIQSVAASSGSAASTPSARSATPTPSAGAFPGRTPSPPLGAPPSPFPGAPSGPAPTPFNCPPK